MTTSVADNWYEDFFQGINCELWEKAVSANWTNQEVDFLVAELDLKTRQSLLDIPCGFGRHSIELAKRGFNVTGVDISQTFIRGLTEKIKTEELPITAIQADILSLQLDQKYSAAICMGNSFGYFNFEKTSLFAEKVSSWRDTGSKFNINSGMVAENILPNFSKNKSFTIDDITMDITNTYSVDGSFMISNILYTKGNKTEEHSFKHYVFTLGEIQRLLKMHGLNVIHTYNSPGKAEFKLGDQQIYIVAEKK